MKRSLLPATILLVVLRTLGQSAGTLERSVVPDPYSDSLQRLLKTASSDTARAQLYFLLSDYWSDKDSTRALRYIAS
ncbi:MAG TPA: hypothetical protein VHC48_14080, partial [Puia sp.]|nr:hypothetical protein [Puia sp.]